MLLSVLAAGVVQASPIRVFAAGSLHEALKEEITASGLDADVAPPVFGPAGLLGQRLASGDIADLFLSADTKAPESLVRSGRATIVVPFARNRLCLISRTDLGINAANLLDKLLDPKLRLATSTPTADPGGDYAFAALQKANDLRVGAGSTLQKKALKLLGAPNAMVPIAGKSPGATVFLSNHADALLFYCSGQDRVLREAPGLTSTPLPPALTVPIVYAMAVMSEKPDALRLALFILSDKGQAILAHYGFVPLTMP